MAAPYSVLIVEVTGNTLSATDYNNEHQNHCNNNIPTSVSPSFTNVAGMQATVDPGGVGTEVLPGNLTGELQEMRAMMVKITGLTYWYSAPAKALNTLLPLSGGTMSGAIAMGGTNKITGLAAATTSGDALRYEQLNGLYLLLTGGTLSGTLTTAAISAGGSVTFDSTSHGIVGNTGAATVAAGLVGEVLQANYASVNAGTSGQFADGTSLALTAGNWLVIHQAMCIPGGATITGNTSFGVGTTTGNSSAGLVDGTTHMYLSPQTTTSGFGNAVHVILKISVGATYYAKTKATYTTATPTFSGSFIAIRLP